jgi:hypothetical protein
MNTPAHKRNKRSLAERVHQSANLTLKNQGAVGPIDLLLRMGIIQSVHFDHWQRMDPAYGVLEEHIQCGSEKLTKIFRLFRQWVSERNLESTVAPYVANSRSGERKLRLLIDDDPQQEEFLQMRYRRADLTAARKKQIDKKLTKIPDLAVFILSSDDCRCSECDEAIIQGDWMHREEDKPLCLECADLAHLEFLPSGDATLTRRAKKFSVLSAVVMEFNRRRKRFERRGILVTQQAIEEAEASMDFDADKRAVQRERAAVQRDKQDEQLVQTMHAEILRQFPHCPSDAALRIAVHTAKRGSGRVGRSAAGRDVDPHAIKLAVIAHIRHEHTPYDEMLMNGVARREARLQIQAAVAEKLSQWQAGA